MRVAFCITTLEVGGAERTLTELATRLVDEGCQVAVWVLGEEPENTRCELRDRLAAVAIEVRFLRGRRPWHVMSIGRRLARELAEFRPDLLQTFLHHANVLGAWAARHAGVEQVVSGIRVAERRANTHRWLARRFDYLVSRHVCVSHDVATFARDVIGLPADKLIVIHNGVEIPAEPVPATLPVELGLPADRGVLVYAGRLDPQKRLHWLLARMPQVFAQLPDHDLLVVGQGPEEWALRQAATRLAIAARVHFMGWRADARQVLAAADVVLLTSAWEGLPNVLLEAMAAGRPTACTRAEGIAEALGAGASTQLVEPADATRFEQTIVRLASDQELANKVGRLNRDRVLEHFRYDLMVRRYLELYRELTRSR